MPCPRTLGDDSGLSLINQDGDQLESYDDQYYHKTEDDGGLFLINQDSDQDDQDDDHSTRDDNGWSLISWKRMTIMVLVMEIWTKIKFSQFSALRLTTWTE